MSFASPAAKPRRARGAPIKPARIPLSVTLPAVLVGGNDDVFRHVIHGLLVTEGRLGGIRAGFGRAIGLSGAQYTILMAVARMQGQTGVGIRAVAAYLRVATSHITTEVGKLVGAGLLLKRADAEDGRAVRVALSDKGNVAMRRVAPFVREVNDVLFAGVTRAQFESLERFLDKFLANTERAARLVAERRTSGRVGE
jgi:DNA-binding MarR family transcriptional regulator